MSRPIQEYVNSLVNKQRIFYLDLNNNPQKKQDHACPNCSQKLQGRLYCNNCDNENRQLSGEIADLKEFTNLRGVNASNNQFTNLDFLNTLPNKDKLKSLNFFGNKIKEIDFAKLFIQFPNLEKINLQGNPLSAKNLNNLTSEQFGKLVNGIKDKNYKINSFQGTILTDLLAYANELVKNGNIGHTQTSNYLQTLINQESLPTKDNMQPNKDNSLLIGGLVLFGISILAIGYLLGWKSKNRDLEE